MSSRLKVRNLFGVFFVFLLAACVPDNTKQPPGTSGNGLSAQSGIRYWIGATMTAVEIAPTAQADGRTAGLRVDFLRPEGGLALAGLHEGDVILTYDHKPTASTPDLVTTVNAAGSKSSPVEFLRNGEKLTLEVTAQAADSVEYLKQERLAEQQRSELEQKMAADAEAAGNFKAAFDHYVFALRIMYVQARYERANNGDAINIAVSHIATVLPRLPLRPRISSNADRHNRQAIAILKTSSSDEDNDRAAGEFFAALYEAPWLSDLYLNLGLAMAKAGYPEGAAIDLRRYLMLNPSGVDVGSIRQKLAELDVLSEDRKPWLAFLNSYPMARFGNIELITLRDRRLRIVVTKNGGPYKVGDVVCTGVIHGLKFQGTCGAIFTEPEAVKCFGASSPFESEGEITSDHVLTVRSRSSLNYNTQTCHINSQAWETMRTYQAASGT